MLGYLYGIDNVVPLHKIKKQQASVLISIHWGRNQVILSVYKPVILEILFYISTCNV